jgi:hypothetical protein
MVYEERVNIFFNFLSNQHKKPKFLTLYFEEVDNAGHFWGK